MISDFYYIPEIIDYQREFPKLIDIKNIKIRKSSIDDLDIKIPHCKFKRKSAEVMSKVLLLAKDNEIENPTVFSQIKKILFRI
ncbi:hypothetical protein [Chryseobacterium sp. Hurlbut01]|uniref:DUF7737 domain-containing protein n=1 Tax=Chryseobacterium sp. Hurlbut01 TaxID=1681828 RepID=UPI00067B42FB|nr:hypothetical protein [Chryseobacterium sp. Hurlbut01]KNB63048.1 hypothetical protein AC804_00060 [Chryseobacterium sp. Hurlbut01]